MILERGMMMTLHGEIKQNGKRIKRGWRERGLSVLKNETKAFLVVVPWGPITLIVFGVTCHVPHL